MKFYITARSTRVEEAKALCATLKAQGHTITFDWPELPMVKPYSLHQTEAAEFVQKGIQGVIDADVYIKFSHADGNGVFTEFGAALSAWHSHGTPRIFVIGTDVKDYAMFYAHPAIIWKESGAAVMADLGITEVNDR